MSNEIIVILLIFTVIHYNYQQINGFNLSPKPNIILREPDLAFVKPKTQSSYFGFTLNLKTNSILIGAPRAQSTIELQRRITEPGAIYKCNLETEICLPFVFDSQGNINEEYNQYAYNMETKDRQWLGMSMDGNGEDSEKFIVCAPRVIAEITNNNLMNGLCYFTTNTSLAKPQNPYKITPLRLKSKQLQNIQGNLYYDYMFGEQGLSVHLTEDNEDIIIGAPGIFHWRGSVIRFRAQIPKDHGGLNRRRRQLLEYVTEIPNPYLWGQDDNSYFGYAVSSGYFEGPAAKRILYLASAPQARLQHGEAYVFDIIEHFSSDKTIKIYYKFSGNQMGESFGYTLIGEDFDNDKYADVAIAAPFHGKSSSYDNGAVYVYRNLGGQPNGKWSSNFELRSILTTDYSGPGRFGMAMSRVGDLNQDGFNDIVIGAPYENDGVVYIYFGGVNGLSTVPNQRIIGPKFTTPFPYPETPQRTFGHGLSKGVDIDNNKYLDIAVGDPNSEFTYIYKAYPVVKVVASINASSQTLESKDSTFKLYTCWSLLSRHPIVHHPRINILIRIDQQVGRALFSDGTNQMELNKTAGTHDQCITNDISVKFSPATIFKSIDLIMEYSIVDSVPNSEVFCDRCVAINPMDQKQVKHKILFSTGCKSEVCTADLNIKYNLHNSILPYVIGSSQSITVDYEISNAGETAFLPQITIKIHDQLTFLRIPSSCQLDEKQLKCELNNGKALYRGEVTFLSIVLDTTKVDGQSIFINADVSSTGNEFNIADNKVELNIPLAEFSDLEVTGKSSKIILSLKDSLNIENVTHLFEIRNNGPSTVKNMDIIINIPVVYAGVREPMELIDFRNITIVGQHDNQLLNVEWSQNNTIIYQQPRAPGEKHSAALVENLNDMQFNRSDIDEQYLDLLTRHRRDEMDKLSNNYFNRYTQTILPDFIDHHHIEERSISFKDDSVISNLPENRTILFDCHMDNHQENLCLQATFSVNNFKAGNYPILIALNFTIDLDKIDKIVTDKRDIFLMKTSVEIRKTGDEESNSISIIQTQPYTIFSKNFTLPTPLWIYIVSTIGGLLALILITYGLYKMGFFKRAKKDELMKLKRQSQAVNPVDTEDELQ